MPPRSPGRRGGPGPSGRGGDLPGTHVVRPAPSAGLAGPEAGLAASSCPSQTLALTGVTARRRTTVSLSRWPSGAAPCPRCRNERADPGRGPDCRTAARGSTTAPQVTTWTSWHRWTAISLLAYAFLAVSSAWQRTLDGSAGLTRAHPRDRPRAAETAPRHRHPRAPPRQAPPRRPGRYGAAATSTKPSEPTSAGTLTPTNRHDNDLQLPSQWGPPVRLHSIYKL